MIYAVIPFTDPPAGALFPYMKRCGLREGGSVPLEPNGDVADLAITFVSHELSEAITDPLDGVSFVGSNNPAWAGSSEGEVADRCETAGDPNTLGNDPNAYLPVLGGDAASGTEYTEVVNGHPYFTQSDWSNATGSCLMRTGVTGGGTAGTGGGPSGTAGPAAPPADREGRRSPRRGWPASRSPGRQRVCSSAAWARAAIAASSPSH